MKPPFSDYSYYFYADEPGVFTYKLRWKERTKAGNYTLFLDCTNGEKHRVTLFKDGPLFDYRFLNPGTRIAVSFEDSASGKCYAKRIHIVDGSRLPYIKPV